MHAYYIKEKLKSYQSFCATNLGCSPSYISLLSIFFWMIDSMYGCLNSLTKQIRVYLLSCRLVWLLYWLLSLL